MKRIWNKIGSTAKSGAFLKKAINHVAEVEKGDIKVVPPKYPTERKHEADEVAKKEIFSKNERLVENMNKMKITSTDPVERWTSTKDLPTRESEFLHRNDPIWEYGFYEPSPERIPKNKLMFREALEFMRLRQQIEGSQNPKQKIEATEALKKHSAPSRVDAELLEDIYEYFRPFERKDLQKVVNRRELAALQDHLQNNSDQRMLYEEAGRLKDTLSVNAKFLNEYRNLDDTEKEKVREAIMKLRQEEHERLGKRLAEIELTEKESAEAIRTKRAEQSSKSDEKS
ncbi:unnamed protein product [Caenorhabditis bovis]|uniref:Uncharacterized protein n=1 Tax=Caenorhabditis bovis TaxID=2654633 RepID=A0A8S1FDQ3_9PELO|nr:unnamed protein product [Caenorhabditis bovis]